MACGCKSKKTTSRFSILNGFLPSDRIIEEPKGGGCSSGGCCSTKKKNRLPEWFRQEVPDPVSLEKIRKLLSTNRLHTVCESAKCPNLGQCWNKGTATFMILGDICTRACRFCSVTAGKPEAPDDEEPLLVADAVVRLGLRYVVITSVARDDLDDQGALHFARTVEAVKAVSPQTKVELLIPDLQAEEDLLRIVVESGAEVIGHNIETVRRLTPRVRSRAEYDRTLDVLRTLRRLSPSVIIKSGLMVGLGETQMEVLETMRELCDAGCQVLTIGQYLAPTQTSRHLAVEGFATPEEFELYKQAGLKMGFRFIHAGPKVRSSYLAEEGYDACLQVLEACAR